MSDDERGTARLHIMPGMSEHDLQDALTALFRSLTSDMHLLQNFVVLLQMASGDTALISNFAPAAQPELLRTVADNIEHQEQSATRVNPGHA